MVGRGAEPVWQTTKTQNLIRYVPKGTYYARFKAGGKLFRRTLGTDVYSVAKLRLGDVIAEQRSIVERGRSTGKLTFADVLSIYRQRVEVNPASKPATKRYRIMMTEFILKTWPGVVDKNVSKITERECLDWYARFQKRFAPSVTNNGLGTLRAIFDEAVELGARFSNPAMRLKRVANPPKFLSLPSRDKFHEFVGAIENARAPQSKHCAAFVRFLAYSGLRKTEAKFLTWSDIDFRRNEITVRGHPQTRTKNNEPRRVPMNPALRELLEILLAHRNAETSHAPVLVVNEAEKSMRRAAAMVGISHLRHHDLRHFFATMCIESGVDLPTVAHWLGHKDHGALAMKVYGHLRDEHSAAQAERVRFSN